MQIKIIATSRSKWDRLTKKWGVSFLLDDDILFDTFGKPAYLQKQIAKQKIDVLKIKHVVLSHKDWDHISGVWNILSKFSEGKTASVYICRDFEGEFTHKLKSYNVNLIDNKGVLKIKEGVFLINELTGIADGKAVCEQFLVIKRQAGLVIITGCAHPGIDNMTKWAKNYFDNDIFMVIGGFHLKDKSGDEILNTVNRLKSLGVKKIAPTHCTGRHAIKLFRKKYGIDFIELKDGSSIDI